MLVVFLSYSKYGYRMSCDNCFNEINDKARVNNIILCNNTLYVMYLHRVVKYVE